MIEFWQFLWRPQLAPQFRWLTSAPLPLGMILFLIGLFYSFSNWVKSIMLCSAILSAFFPFGFLINWWLIMLLLGILTNKNFINGYDENLLKVLSEK